MQVQLVLGPVMLDNLKLMIEQVVVNSPKKQLRGDERAALIDSYSDAIALSHLKKESFRQDGSFWASINLPIKEKFGIGTMTKIKEAAWELFEKRRRAGFYTI